MLRVKFKGTILKKWLGIGILVSWDNFKGISIVLPGFTADIYLKPETRHAD